MNIAHKIETNAFPKLNIMSTNEEFTVGDANSNMDIVTWEDTECTKIYQDALSAQAKMTIAIVVPVSIILLGGIYYFHRRALKKQELRNRRKFAERIAETVNLVGSTRKLTPDAVAQEFKTICKTSCSSDGCITREALWEFLDSGKVGTLSKKDFDAMFAAIDLDQDGIVDFLEFAAYLGRCGDELEEAKQRRSTVYDNDEAWKKISRSVSMVMVDQGGTEEAL